MCIKKLAKIAKTIVVLNTSFLFNVLLVTSPVSANPFQGNLAPDCNHASPDNSTLWPPNHELGIINILGINDPDGDDITTEIQCIRQDEALNSTGDGSTEYDGSGVGSSTASVRKERKGNGNGRVYHISYITTDTKGASCGGIAKVSVRKNKKRTAVDEGPLYDSANNNRNCDTTNINNAPTAFDQSLSLDEDTSIGTTLTASDPDQDLMTFSIETTPTHGVLTGEAPNLVYTPNPDFNGEDSFTFKTNDGLLDSEIASVTINVVAINDLPIAQSQSLEVNEDTLLSIILTGSDIDNDGDNISLSVINQSTSGTLSGTAPDLVYTPNANFSGSDSFTFIANDGQADSTIATISITVLPVNDTPIAQSQSLEVNEDQSLSITLAGSDLDGDSLSYAITDQPNSGTLSGTAPNLTYTPNANFHGADSFSFKVNDGAVDSGLASINITVNSINDAPTVNAGVDQTIIEGSVVILQAVADDSDGTIVSQEWKEGTQTVGNTLGVTFNDLSVGVHTFTITVTDNKGTTASDNVTVTVEPKPNTAPVAEAQTISMDEDTETSITLSGTDNEGDTLTFVITSDPQNGALNGIAPNLSYVPNANYHGIDSFTFKVNDGFFDSNVATVNILVNPGIEECVNENMTIGELNPVAKWHWKSSNSQSLPDWQNPYSSPIVVPLEDTNNDNKTDSSDIPVVVFHTHKDSNALDGSVLRAISGLDGRELWTLETPILGYATDIAAGDIDGDGLLEIITQTNDSKLLILENDGKVKFIGTENIDPINSSFSINDIDHDGSPEIIYGSTVFDNNGKLLWKGTGYKGLNNYTSHATSIVADINLDGDSEVIAGPAAYDSSGAILWSTNIGDGYTALGNFDKDKYPEIVLMTKGKVYLLSHEGEIVWGPVTLPGGGGNGGGGAPTVADVDGDGEPEIGIAGANYYVVFETDGSIKWTSEIKDSSSAITGSSVFDFENDGKVEIIYADEDYLRIYSGESGNVLYQLENSSGTAKEIPVVVDADKDGSADIIFISNDYSTRTSNGIKMISGLNNIWAPTRSIWNQHSYHINNINDNGTIPRVEEPSWLTHNSYRLNTFAVDTRCPVAPKAFEEEYKGLENTPTNIALVAKDRNNDLLTYTIVQHPQQGTLSGEGIFRVYTPNKDYVGTDSFSFKVNDGTVDSETVTISIEIKESNKPPKITSQANPKIAENTLYSYDVDAIDPNNQSVTYETDYSPQGSSIDSTSGLFTSYFDGSQTESIRDKNLVCKLPSPDIGSFEPVVKWEWNKGGVLSQPMVAPLSDTNGDGKINTDDDEAILFIPWTGDFGNSNIVAVDGKTGNEIWRSASGQVGSGSHVAVGDLDNDGLPEIVAVSADDGTVVYDNYLKRSND